ncbi:MAG: choice-of-anchor A family protein [Bryobacterales bacterium]|nr:choice-of-anchor A family protein [Bryobacterales bacterium]
MNFVNVGANTTVVVNVKGANVNGTNSSYFINGSAVNGDASSALASRILFNYFEATSLFMNSGVQGKCAGAARGGDLGVGADGAAVGRTVALQRVPRSRTDAVEKAGDARLQFRRRSQRVAAAQREVPEPATWMLSAAGLAAFCCTVAGLKSGRRGRETSRTAEGAIGAGHGLSFLG